MAHTTRITEVLRNRNFFMLWIGQIVSALGDRFHQMAIMGIIPDLLISFDARGRGGLKKQN